MGPGGWGAGRGAQCGDSGLPSFTGFFPSEAWCWQARPQCLAVRTCLEPLHSTSLDTGPALPCSGVSPRPRDPFSQIVPCRVPPWCLHTEPRLREDHFPVRCLSPVYSSGEGVTGGCIPLRAPTEGSSEEIPHRASGLLTTWPSYELLVCEQA